MMKDMGAFSEQVEAAFKPTDLGIVGLVDALLLLCRDGGIQLEWCANTCRIRSLETGQQELTAVPLTKSVFRAILARIAVLCNERSPNSVSPYGGEGEITLSTNPQFLVHVAFVNAKNEQRLEVAPRNGIQQVPRVSPRERVGRSI
jgi:hypothetical protein